MSFIDEVQALLPDVEVSLAPHKSVLKKLWASAVSGVSGMTRVRAVRPSGYVLTLSLPERDDLVPRAVAIAIATTFAIHDRFGEAATYVDSISFDQSQHGMAEGKVGGAAPHIIGEVHINANYVVGEFERRDAFRLTATIAHELWHKIEMGWESVHYPATVEFRKALGSLFGKPTIEQVFSDPDARTRLIEAVTAYAATNRLEATAEMFMLWWVVKPKDNLTIEAFGEIVDRFLPAS